MTFQINISFFTQKKKNTKIVVDIDIQTKRINEDDKRVMDYLLSKTYFHRNLCIFFTKSSGIFFGLKKLLSKKIKGFFA